jgi:O-antigen/teichoic acid export membrane protein
MPDNPDKNTGSYRRLLQGDGLLARALRACSWAAVGAVLLQAIRMSRMWILTWLLAPKMFGLLALIWCVLGLLRMLSDTGMRQSLVQNPNGLQQKYLDTAWWFNLARNILIAILLYIAAPYAHLAGGVYQEPQLPLLLRLSCLILLLEGVTSIGLAAMHKKLNFRPVTMVQVASQIIGTVATLFLAWCFRNASAVVIGEIITAAVLCVLSYMIYPYRPRLCWDIPIIRQLLGFGIMAYMVTLLGTSAFRLDVLLLGNLASGEELGIYSLAMTLIWAVSLMFSQLAITVGFPTLVHIQHDKAKLRRGMIEIVKAVHTISLPVFALLAVFACDLVRIMPEKYTNIGPILSSLSVFGFCLVFLFQISPSFYAANKLHWLVISSLLQMTILLVLLWPMYHRWHLTGLCWAVNIAIMTADIFLWLVSLRLFGWTLRQWFKDTAMLTYALTAATVTCFITWLVLTLLGFSPHDCKWSLYIVSLVSVVAYLVVCLNHYHRRVMQQ